ncbi:MAG: hypothetical protein JXB15_09975 [Anaerolineales bacterium]|nr:hypothetical protein [Anaerolineales bacterium]
MNTYKFPQVTGKNLLRQTINLPEGLQGRYNLVIIPFYQWHQWTVDTWIPTARRLEQEYLGFCYYELPTIRRMNYLSRGFINEGMRMGIPGKTTRERTITLYLDKKSFRRDLGIPHEEDVFAILIDQQGNILWRSDGEYSPEKGASLEDLLKELISTPVH